MMEAQRKERVFSVSKTTFRVLFSFHNANKVKKILISSFFARKNALLKSEMKLKSFFRSFFAQKRE